MCAGTILNSWTILSAAHCFEIDSDVEDITINVGGTYLDDEDMTMYEVLQVDMHPDYNTAYQFDSDIALVFVLGPIKLGPRAKKAVLVNSQAWMNEKQKHFVVSGWGLTEEKGQVSDRGLMQAVLSYIDTKRCSEYHHVLITENMFCLYGNAVQDSCRGDSGGGVFWHNFVVGIVSHGNGCARKNRPSVYTNVFNFRDWIKSRVYLFMDKYCSQQFNNDDDCETDK